RPAGGGDLVRAHDLEDPGLVAAAHAGRAGGLPAGARGAGPALAGDVQPCGAGVPGRAGLLDRAPQPVRGGSGGEAAQAVRSSKIRWTSSSWSSTLWANRPNSL